jgi:Secretion system C-terminal sorting domain
MKTNLILGILFAAVILVASENSINDTNLIGGTELNGNGCVCHTTERDYSVDVWVEGPDTLYAGEIGIYKMFLTGGPAEAGGYNVAGRFGEMVLVDSFSFQHPLAMNELTQAFSLPFPSPEDTIYWEFGYLASDSSTTDTIYSCGLSLVWDTIPDPLDRWNFGPKFPLTIMPVTSVDSEGNELPDDFSLYQNYPNPFNPSTIIKYRIPELRFVTLKVYDVLGNVVATLVNEEKTAGDYTVNFVANNLSSGIYFYKIEAGNSFVEVKKMIFMK